MSSAKIVAILLRPQYDNSPAFNEDSITLTRSFTGDEITTTSMLKG